jgi:GNAT superfamily N-acetyltransferase
MSVPTRQDVLNRVKKVLASDCSCDPADFERDTSIVTMIADAEGRRRYAHRSDPFIVTFGRGVVASASEEHHGWLEKHLECKSRDDIFSAASIAEISTYVSQFNCILYGPDLKYVCSGSDVAGDTSGDSVVLLEGEDVYRLYQTSGFPNALQYRRDHPQPDVLATVVYASGFPVAVAGASADCDDMWQIGIDVLPDHRGTGVGRDLVVHLTQAILDRGKVPYYSTSPSNIGSRRLARAAGFWPAWTELRTWERS